MKLGAQKIGCLGGGAMGFALLHGLRDAGCAPTQLCVADRNAPRRKRAEQLGITAVQSGAALLTECGCETLLLAVKPAQLHPALQQCAAEAGADAMAKPLWISVAAGVSLARIAGALPQGARVIRAMPNTPALAGAAATAWFANAACTDADAAHARALFEAVGAQWQCPAEALLNAATGLSGSGPAYVFVLVEALADAGVRAGLPRAAAQQLAVQTVFGAAKLVQQSGLHPAQLKDQVASPGGTTIAGLVALEAGGFRAALHDAVAAAAARARELGE